MADDPNLSVRTKVGLDLNVIIDCLIIQVSRDNEIPAEAVDRNLHDVQLKILTNPPASRLFDVVVSQQAFDLLTRLIDQGKIQDLAGLDGHNLVDRLMQTWGWEFVATGENNPEIVARYAQFTKESASNKADFEDAKRLVEARQLKSIVVVSNDRGILESRGLGQINFSYPFIITPRELEQLDVDHLNKVLSSLEKISTPLLDQLFGQTSLEDFLKAFELVKAPRPFSELTPSQFATETEPTRPPQVGDRGYLIPEATSTNGRSQ